MALPSSEGGRTSTAGRTLLGMSPYQFRRVWAQARLELRVSHRYTPDSLRRGGATMWFQFSGSFDKVADKGRWQSIQATRQYVTTALQEMASEDILGTMGVHLQGYAKRLG